ncbi:MAG: hypothetical protein JOZ32_06030 [Bryobacterales bacterium]|nr:hypothetical protein [Bryobacterales bacterium]
MKLDQGIDTSILWRPTFYLRPSKFRIIAVEVEDNLYPNSLKGAAHEVSHYDFPISVYQACTLSAFQSDPKHKQVNLLKKHGFGIITVDEDGIVVIQHTCVPLAQHISPDLLDREIKPLTPQIKVAFRSAYDVYLANEGQGLQDAGQIVEGLVACLAAYAVKNNVIPAGALGGSLADRIDALYGTNKFKPHRAALGGTRDFIREFRNTASHPPTTAKQAAEKIRKCRKGFLDAVGCASKLRAVAKAVHCPIRIYVT